MKMNGLLGTKHAAFQVEYLRTRLKDNTLKWYMLGQPKQLVDVTQADDKDIQSEFIDEQLAKGSHLMMGVSKEKSLGPIISETTNIYMQMMQH